MKLSNEQKLQIRRTLYENNMAQICDSVLVLENDEMECSEENEVRQEYANKVNRRLLNKGDLT